MEYDGDQGAQYYDMDEEMGNGMGGMGGMGGMPGGRTTFKMSGNGGNIDPNEIFKMFFSGNGMKMGNQMGGQMGNDNDDFGFGNFGGFSGFSGFGNMGGNMGGFKNFKGRGNSQQKSYNFS